MNPPSRLPLCCLPTPCHPLPRLSEAIGQAEIWIKRDDLTGFAAGGNKGRKLEYIAPLIQAEEPDLVVGIGAQNSNFVRQMAGLCAVLGVPCHAIAMEHPFEEGFPHDSSAPAASGNDTLVEQYGATRDIIPDGTWEDLDQARLEYCEWKRAEGLKVFSLPTGGSIPEGAYSYFKAFEEIVAPFDHIVVASSSGSTLAGLATAAENSPINLIGISCDPEEENREDVLRLNRALHERYGLPKVTNLDLRFDYVGGGYGVPTEAGTEAQRLFAQHEALNLDRTYTAKSASGMIDLIRKGEISGRVLYWHTGGFPATLGPSPQ